MSDSLRIFIVEATDITESTVQRNSESCIKSQRLKRHYLVLFLRKYF